MRNVLQRTWFSLLFVGILLLSWGLTQPVYSQPNRNPVLEFCTGTWCQWCPCGHHVVHDDILPQIPNAIILAYHGAGSDPFRTFSGNSIMSGFGFSAYPSGIVNRTTGIIYRDNWLFEMNFQQYLPPTINIEMDKKGYNPFSRQFRAIIKFTALQNLSGEYNWNIILLEDGLVYAQSSNNTCTPGTTNIPDYVHDSVVRTMMNGALGAQLLNGTLNKDEVITKTFDYTMPDLSSMVADLNPRNCRIVVLVYKVGTPLSSNADIQQAEQWPLMTPGYAATIATLQDQFFGSQSEPAQFSAVLKNTGIHPDTFKVELDFSGPADWSPSFTTVNGTFNLGETNEVAILPGDSTTMTVTVDAKSIPGVGTTFLRFLSNNFISGSVDWKFITYGLNLLAVDDEDSTFESYFDNTLMTMATPYGVVSSDMLLGALEHINSFDRIFWMCALTEPALSQEEQNALAHYLDNGGKLYLSGVDVAYQLADSTSPYYSDNSLHFFNHYLHANYVKREYDAYIIQGIQSDPITNVFSAIGLRGGAGANTVEPREGRYANQIAPADSNTWPIFSYFQHPDDYTGIRAYHNGTGATGKVVFTTFGFESLTRDGDRKLLAEQIIKWMDQPSGIAGTESPQLPEKLKLRQNYPNPFNPETRIAYEVPIGTGAQQVTLAIFNQLGQKVRTLVRENQGAGRYEVTWNGLDDQGKPVVSGVYVYALQYGHYQDTKKLILLR